MRIVKNLVNKNLSMKKLLTAAILLTAIVGTVSAQGGEDGVDIISEIPEEGERIQKVELPTNLTIEGEVYTNETAELYSVIYDGSYTVDYHPENDTYTTSTGANLNVDENKYNIGTFDNVGEYEDYITTYTDADSGSKTLLLIVERDDRDPVFEVVHFSIVEEVPDVESEDRIIDGGIIDEGINTTSELLGLGLDTTRMMIGFFLALFVGLAIGWTNSYKSAGIAYIGFTLTFITGILIGLVPAVEGIIFTALLFMGIWLHHKHTDTVVIND